MGTSFFIQLLLLFIILLSPLTIAKTNATHAQTQCIGLEKSLLLELRKQLVFNSPYSRKLVQWNQSEDCCRWGGVRCDSGGHVIGLVLRDEGISGGLDESSSLFGLEYLEELDLSHNSLSGSIPLSIFTHLPSLSHLNLSCNMLVGLQKPYDIPASLSFRVLDLHSNKLEGEFPFSLVHRAWYLDLSNNRLSGSCPTSICSTKRLQLLDLSNNNLTGTIPDCLFKNVESLEVLNLGRNGISGHIPDSFSIHSSLISLDLSDNSLVGDVPLSLAKCSSLLVLNLSGNKLSGTVPTNLTLFGRLTVLNLGKNNMTGHIPNFTADCPLQYLVLNNNNFIGGVPLSLANCKLLEVMNVEGNRIEGSFPCMLPSSLQVLVLRSNRFHGDVTCPKSKTWPNLQIIDIASNGFNGYLNSFNFPTWRGMTKDTVTKSTYKNLGFSFTMDNSWAYAYYKEEVTLTIKGVERKLVKIWPDFISIDFSDNNFHGGIPDSIGGLDALYLLNLSHNSLTGTIPESFGKLRQLESLDLSVNHIIGIIPTEIAGLTFLQIMNVSHNKLMGRIPVGTQIQSFSPDYFEGNAGLCGPPLNTSCNSETSPKLAEGDDQESEGEETEWEYVFAAAAVGYAVGLGSFSWLLLICRSFRYKYFEKIEVVFHVIFDCCHSSRREEVKEQELRGFSLPNRVL